MPSEPSKVTFVSVAHVETKRWLLVGLWVITSLVFGAHTFAQAVQVALNNDDASHILLIPLLSVALIYIERRTIFRRVSWGYIPAALLGATACISGALSIWEATTWSQSSVLALGMSAAVLTWMTGFALIFGGPALRAAKFPLLLTLLAIPLPGFLLSYLIYFLQRGSAEIVAVIFDVLGVPYLREEFVFRLARVSIEIAQECSGIRSSIAVLILALIAAHFYLQSFWKQAIFVLCSILIMLIKNGIRIATLTLLSIYVNPSFLFGRLHREGGIVFFLVGLALLAPMLWLVNRLGMPREKLASTATSR